MVLLVCPLNPRTHSLLDRLDQALVIRPNQDFFFCCSTFFDDLACSGLACSRVSTFDEVFVLVEDDAVVVAPFMVCPAGTLFFFFFTGIPQAAPALALAVFVVAPAVFGPQPQSGGSITYKNVPFAERFIGYTFRNSPGNVVEIPPNN